MTKKRGLGRGLEALLRDISKKDISIADSPSENSIPIGALDGNEGALQALSVDHVQGGKYQPRRAFSEEGIEELANSIRAQGIIQPIVVRSIAKGKYEIVAGERRWRAAKLVPFPFSSDRLKFNRNGVVHLQG